MSETERVLVDTELDVPPDVLWVALRDPEQVGQWFGWDADGLAAEIQQIFVSDASADEQALTVTWPDGDRLAVEERDGRCHLVVVRQGHSGLQDFDGVYDPIDEGWITFAQQLRFWLDRHRGEPRRTVSATGVDLGTDEAPLLSRLGLRHLGEDPVGAEYTVARPDGTTFSGEVFFQTDLQVGLTVVEEGDALLVVARTPPTSSPPNGAATFILSTYGLDRDRLTETARLWSDWWSAPQP